jgi:hypothetical protein
MPFGLRDATQTFQWFMGEILKDLDFCFAYEQHPCLPSFPHEHNQYLLTPLPNSKPMAPSRTHPSMLSVSLKYPSWDTRPHPKVPGSPIMQCYTCQHSKVSHHTVIPFGDFPLPTAHFLHIHIDLVGPLLSLAGFQYHLTVVDCCTHWPEAFPLPDITKETVFRAHSLVGYPTSVEKRRSRQTKDISSSPNFSTAWQSYNIHLCWTSPHFAND